MTQPTIAGWNSGNFFHAPGSGSTNQVIVTTNCNGLGSVSWWRNLNVGEDLRSACLDFWKKFPFAAMGTNNASCVVDEFSPTGRTLIVSAQFSFDSYEINLPIAAGE